MSRQSVEKTDLNSRILLELRANHRGRANAIKSKTLAHKVGENSRSVRAAISEMRKEGRLILSAVRPPYGYYIAATRQEWSDFRDSNLRPRAYDILKTDKAMAKAAEARWGQPVQLMMAGFMGGE